MARMSSVARWLNRVPALLAVVMLGLASLVGSGGDTSSSTDGKQQPTYASFAGTWRGSLAEATSGSFGETVLNLQQSGAALSGTWTAWFNSGAVNGGTISGTVIGNASTADFRLTSTGLEQCPFAVTVALQTSEAQGTYASVNCPVLSTGTVHVYKDGASGPTYVPPLPAAPTGVVAIPGKDQVTIRWTRVAGASSHNVYWRLIPGVTPANGTKVPRVSEPATIPLAVGGTYYFVVTAENMTGEGPASAEVAAPTIPAAPNAPTNVLATAGDGKATVTWDPVADATAYNLYWSTNPGQAFSVGTRVSGVSSPHTLTGLTNATTYFIAVTSTNAGGESAPSVEARVTPYQTFTYDFDSGTLQGWTPSGTWAVTAGTSHSGSYAVTDSPGGNYADNSDSVLVSPSFHLPGKYVYVANYQASDVSQYAIGADGALRPMVPSRVAAGTNPAAVVVEPSGRYAYVANYGGTVSQYTVGPSGALLPMVPATVAAGTSAEAVAIDPTARFVYVADGAGSVWQYAVGVTGALAPMAPPLVAAGAGPAAVIVDPTGKYVYAVNRLGNSVSQYVIGTGGALTPMAPSSVGAGSSPYSIAIDPAGKYAYVANWGDNNVSQYSIGASGALVPMAPAAVPTGTGPRFVAVDRTGKHAYVANSDFFFGGTVSQYSIGASGALTPLSPATVAVGTGPHSISIDPTGTYAYVANYYSNDVSQFAVGSAGTLMPISPATAAAGTNAISVIVDPSGNRSPALTFWHRYALEPGYDWARVEISVDGGATWTTLRMFNGTQVSWIPETVGLQGYSGPDVRIRFRLTTDASGTSDGWYLDDIVISR